MQRKSPHQRKKGDEPRPGTDRQERPQGPQTGANSSAVDPSAALGQEATLASALQTFRLDRHGSYTAQVETALREAIVRGRLSPGTSLSEAGISAALGISRTPVREALALLADEQLVVVYPQVRTLVAPVRRSLIDEGRFVRSTLECANHAELMTMITQPQIETLAALIAAGLTQAVSHHINASTGHPHELHQCAPSTYFAARTPTGPTREDRTSLPGPPLPRAQFRDAEDRHRRRRARSRRRGAARPRA